MSIVVVGGGAIGLLVAGRLAQAGIQVALLARPRTVQLLTAQGLSITQEGETQALRLTAAASPADLPPGYHAPALAILCVKGYDTAAALPTLDALQPGLVLTLQNGLGNEETLAAQFGAARVLAGAITSSVEPTDEHGITVTKVGGIGLAALPAAPAPTPWAMALRKAGFTVREYADYRALKWSKVLLNMLGNATAAILDLPVDAVYADQRLIAVERRAFLEAGAVMQRLGVRPVNLPAYPAALLASLMRILPPPLLNPILRKAVAGGRGGKAPSLQRDLSAGRGRSEGAFLYGAIAEQAATIGVPAPVNAALWRVLSEIAVGTQPWSAFRHQPERLLAELEGRQLKVTP